MKFCFSVLHVFLFFFPKWRKRSLCGSLGTAWKNPKGAGGGKKRQGVNARPMRMELWRVLSFGKREVHLSSPDSFASRERGPGAADGTRLSEIQFSYFGADAKSIYIYTCVSDFSGDRTRCTRDIFFWRVTTLLHRCFGIFLRCIWWTCTFARPFFFWKSFSAANRLEMGELEWITRLEKNAWSFFSTKL